MGLEDLLGGILKDVLEQNSPPEMPKMPSRSSLPSGGSSTAGREPTGIGAVMHSVVQVVALKSGFMGGMSSAWTGSGSIVHPSGIVLTNCHVASPRSMGMSSLPADRLGIAITERSDEPPALSYFAEVLVEAPELDLAVLKIVADSRGRRIRELDLPAVPIGDSDALELGDRLAIFGYPGIGGDTVTFTTGNVSGFSAEKGVRSSRAWIKTDATIAGGNSGGTAVNQAGEIVGIPTQAAAGRGVTPVDARPVLDTNRDGRVDRRDTPMAVGGFINGLRPVNLAFPLLEKAGVKIERGRRMSSPSILPTDPFSRGREKPAFEHLVFSTRITEDGRPINPTSRIPAGVDTVYATFEHDNLQHGTPWSVVWMANNEEIINQSDSWDEEEDGRKSVKISNRKGLPAGEYHLVLGIGNQVALEGKVHVGTVADETDSEVSGRLVDARSGQGVSGLVIVLKPGASLRRFMQTQSNDAIFTSAETDRSGNFKFPDQLPKGQAYSLVAAAQGYKPVAVEGALRVGTTAPEHAELGDIEMDRA